ncbi:hypothetical protein NDU88_003290 [Pleurodeles waltl]|uniref:Uncharacterized protein n=1 Tax=Pleurodeles waltl TaxID=8319 RepID=A0AAV7T649_PLEWA|nr:hypothetical protein NDU88_003290 [Pleurodeles waltl]
MRNCDSGVSQRRLPSNIHSRSLREIYFIPDLKGVESYCYRDANLEQRMYTFGNNWRSNKRRLDTEIPRYLSGLQSQWTKSMGMSRERMLLCWLWGVTCGSQHHTFSGPKVIQNHYLFSTFIILFCTCHINRKIRAEVGKEEIVGALVETGK